MKKFLLFALLFCAPAFAQFVNITDTGITDENGLVLANGQECFTPVSAAQYTGGTMVKQTKCLPIAAGVMQPTTLLSSSASSPNNLCYQRVIKNTDTSKTVIGPDDGWGCVTFFHDTNLNTVPPNLPKIALASPGQSAYQVWLNAGNTGTQAQFLASLTGPQGPATVVTANGANGSFAVASQLTAANVWVPEANLISARAGLKNSALTPTNIVVVGDSVLAGVGPTYPDNTPIQQLRFALGRFGNSGTGLVPVGFNNGLATRPEWALSGTWFTINDFGPSQSGTGAFGTVFGTTGGGTATMAHGIGDTLILYGESVPGDAGWDVSVNGAVVATAVGASTSSTASLFRAVAYNSPYLPSDYSVVLTPHGGGTAHLYGAEWQQTTTGITGIQRGVRVHNLAHGYARTEAWATNVDAQMAFIALISPVPDTAILSLGVNDSTNGTGTTLAQYTANMTAIVAKLKSINPQISILILDEQNAQVPGTTLPQSGLGGTRAAAQALAAANGLTYASTADAFGPFATAQALGLMATGDGIHPSDKGGAAIGGLLDMALTRNQHPSFPSPDPPVILGSTGPVYGLNVYPKDSLVISAGRNVGFTTLNYAGETRTVINNSATNTVTLSNLYLPGTNASTLALKPGQGIILKNGTGGPYWFPVSYFDTSFYNLTPQADVPPTPAYSHGNYAIKLYPADKIIFNDQGPSVLTLPSGAQAGESHTVINNNALGSNSPITFTNLASGTSASALTLNPGDSATLVLGGGNYWFVRK